MTAPASDQSLDIGALAAMYRGRNGSPSSVIDEVLRRIERHCDRHIWISTRAAGDLRREARALDGRDPSSLPLYGIPFAIKDNIDLAGLPTTAGCPGFRYHPPASAFVVARLIAAGAIPIGKTNLDQFATGLTGTRCPQEYGICTNSFDSDYIAGGSSSGSAVAVALGIVSFAIGTDTAGSGRVPAAFNNLVGLKPTRGLLSCRGVVPACRSLDCVSIFGLTLDDAERVFNVMSAFDPDDAYARIERRQLPVAATGFEFGVPREEQLEFSGDAGAASLFAAAVRTLEGCGGRARTIDFDPFLQAARLLYEGPWVAERYAVIRGFIETSPASLHPVTRRIIESAHAHTAVEAFEAQYRLLSLKRRTDALMRELACVVTPTAGTIYQVQEVLQAPIALNSRLGYYTNFMNLLDCAAMAVPAGFNRNGLAFGVTLFGPALADRRLMALARRLQNAMRLPLGATGAACPPQSFATRDGAAERFRIVVCGAHMSGLPLNHQLTGLGACLLRRTRTAPRYRLYALASQPPRPGLIRDGLQGASIEVEVWELPSEHVGAFLACVPAPLCVGRVELGDGACEAGFLCEAHAVAGTVEITACGGWREYLRRTGTG